MITKQVLLKITLLCVGFFLEYEGFRFPSVCERPADKIISIILIQGLCLRNTSWVLDQ